MEIFFWNNIVVTSCKTRRVNKLKFMRTAAGQGVFKGFLSRAGDHQNNTTSARVTFPHLALDIYR